MFKTNDIREAVQEIKSLLTEKHEYRTLVIDPITTIYNDLLERSERKVGSDFGRHYGEANKEMKRLANLILALDMNVIVTAHAKTEYGENLKKLGYTFDGWKSLDYWFDLVVELSKSNRKRFARVVKTRIEAFPDEDKFEWSYDAVRQRCSAGQLDRESTPVAMATPEQVQEINSLLEVVRIPEGIVEKWFSKAQVDAWDDMPADTIAKCIEYVRARLGQRDTVPADAA